MTLHSVETRLCAGSAFALAAGVLFYAGARGADPVAPALGAWSGSLPTLLHSTAFALLALAVTAPWPRLSAAVCAAWLAVEAAFELLQLDAVARFVEAGPLASAPRWLRAYLDGTFDPLDVLAAVAGVLLAFLVASRTAARSQGAAR